MDQGQIISAYMPEIPFNRYCHVATYLKYASHLSPLMAYLWQYPKTKEEVEESLVWYHNRKIGANPLASFMSRMSHEADLSRVYTNHSIRVTGMTFLMRNNFQPKQVMAITGHKSLNSLPFYQKVSADEKLAMAFSMSYYLQCNTPGNNQNIQKELQNKDQQNDLPITAPKNVTETIVNPQEASTGESNKYAVVPFENEDPLLDSLDFNIEALLETIENENNIQTQEVTCGNITKTTTKIMERQTTKKSPQIPIFNNCKIGTMNITINK